MEQHPPEGSERSWREKDWLGKGDERYVQAGRGSMMERMIGKIPRRNVLKLLGAAGSGLALASWADRSGAFAQGPAGAKQLESFTGPGANPHWNSVGPYVTEPQKAPLILLTHPPRTLETPPNYFRTVFTPNEAVYLRWHLGAIPNPRTLAHCKFRAGGNRHN